VAEPVVTDELLAAHWRHVDACETTEVYSGIMDFDHRLNVPEGIIIGPATPHMTEDEWRVFVDDHIATLGEVEAIEDATLDPGRAALDSRVMALSRETGLSYEAALDRVLDREEPV
jgi:hypothetical protein